MAFLDNPDTTDIITLTVDGAHLVTQKTVLRNNSEFFRNIFNEEWDKSGKSSFVLEDASYIDLQIIFNKLSDESFVIAKSRLVTVLTTAVNFKFEKIQRECVKKMTQILSIQNCLRYWLVCEKYDIRPLFLQAKCMALEEFLEIKKNNYMTSLKIDELCRYLGHIDLRTDDELSVFYAALNWWEEHKEEVEVTSFRFIRLLSCVDFRRINVAFIRDLISYCNGKKYSELSDILTCYIQLLFNLKQINIKLTTSFDSHIVSNAKILLSGRRRTPLSVPCFFVEHKTEQKTASKGNGVSSIHCKRRSVIYYDNKKKEFTELVAIDDDLVNRTRNYKVMAVKLFIYIFGGEYLQDLEPNLDVRKYDTIPGDWTLNDKKNRYPNHSFDARLINDYIFIYGGQSKRFANKIVLYNHVLDVWEDKAICLPLSYKASKCNFSTFKQRLLVWNFHEKNVCKLNRFKSEYTITRVDDENNELWDMQQPVNFFERHDSLYAKGDALVELKKCRGTDLLKIVSVKTLIKENIVVDSMETVLCGDIVYSLSCKKKANNIHTYTFESYNLITNNSEFIFKDKSNEDGIIIMDGREYSIVEPMQFFSFHHYSLVEDEDYVIPMSD